MTNAVLCGRKTIFAAVAVVVGSIHLALGMDIASGDITTGKWFDTFERGKAYAEANGLPMVLFWSNPGCHVCQKLEQAVSASPFPEWAASKPYVFIFVEGTVSSDHQAAKDFAKNSSGAFPYISVYWAAKGIKRNFSGVSGKMPAREGTLAEEFMNSIELSLPGCVWIDPDTHIAWFYDVSDGTPREACVSAIPTLTTGDITIPSMLDDCPVTSIGYRAFEGCSGLTSVTIPSSVTSIGGRAFKGCVGLADANGFVVVDGVLYDYCGGATSVTIPSGVASIGEGAFSGCSGLKSVMISEGVLSIGDCAFENCVGLTSVTIPSSVTSIGEGAFYGCSEMTSFSVAAANPCYSSPNGLLCSKDGIELIAGVNGNVMIPEGVTIIGYGAFCGCSGLTSVKIPSRVTSIGNDAFLNTPLLESVTLLGAPPSGVVESKMLANYPTNFVFSSEYASEWAEIIRECSRDLYVRFEPAENVATDPQVPVEIEMTGPCAKAKIYYTADGSMPTVESTPYVGKVYISRNAGKELTVSAIAVVDGWPVDTNIVKQLVLTIGNCAEPVVDPVGGPFDGASQTVSISCETEGATIYYTIDGSDPSAVDGRVYKGAFNIYDSVTVKAISVKDDWKDSVVTSVAFTKNNGLSAAIGMYDRLPETDNDASWTVDTAVSHDGVSSVRSGEIVDDGTTEMKVSVNGAGKLSFWWKAECEEPDDGEYYDYGVFRIGSTDSPALAYIAGNSGWQWFETEIVTTGKHVLRWEYHKDGMDSVLSDCIWVDQVQWVPADDSGHTLTTATSIPYLWLEKYGFGKETDFESAAKMKFGKVDGSGRVMSVEDDYVAGTDPTNSLSCFYADIAVVDEVPIVSWYPDLNSNDVTRVYKVWGKKSLDEIRWTYPTNSTHRFFRVTVELP